MLFDPRSFVQRNDVATPSWSSQRQHPAAQRRAADDFLTLPRVPNDVPGRAILVYRDAEDIGELVRSQFETGVLRASDVERPANAADAFAQAMFAWLNAHRPTCHRLVFDLAILERAAAQDELSQFGRDDALDAPLYLGVHLPEENVYVIGDERAAVLRALHPSLIFTAMSLISAADGKSLDVRTPDRLLEQFAMWHWDGDTTLDDESARETMAAYGREDEDAERYLPSAVRAEIATDEFLARHNHVDVASKSLTVLNPRLLRAIAASSNGWAADVCHALADLSLMLRRNGKRSAYQQAQWAEPAYAAATVVMRDNDVALEILDDHINHIYASGEATLYQSFIPIATEATAIREQFRTLGGMLRIIGALDRVLTLITEEATWPSM